MVKRKRGGDSKLKIGETARLLAFITALYPGIDIKEGTVEAWHEMLKDLDYTAAVESVKKVMAEHDYPTLPPVGKVRGAVALLQKGCPLPASEAWGLVAEAIRGYGHTGERKALESLPSLVARVAGMMGWREMCQSSGYDVIRGQFIKLYQEQLQRREEKHRMPEEFRRLAEKYSPPEERFLEGRGSRKF
ncbi:MAG: hypothetical protein D5R97_00550 [Candidatus Syntrophonatronum acetioxidans]|uniref:Uncharacterized protein n=1 Tax=Candidatus Syntrophonatronum acetioxidans TaxID=1795816 RepID=A0A424YIP0_9FIRM|nr:MAG: hypothetical protein D5R97_00550 [Candidatus Syntrophonatronum acetioxidans]